jgi:hypothetical protein
MKSLLSVSKAIVAPVPVVKLYIYLSSSKEAFPSTSVPMFMKGKGVLVAEYRAA